MTWCLASGIYRWLVLVVVHLPCTYTPTLGDWTFVILGKLSPEGASCSVRGRYHLRSRRSSSLQPRLSYRKKETPLIAKQHKMDLFTWPQVHSEQYRHDLVSQDAAAVWIPDATQHDGSWQWNENCTSNYTEQSNTVPFTESTISSPDSYNSGDSFRATSFDGSHFDGSPHSVPLEYGASNELKTAGRPRCPVTSGRDPNENRIQRRRTQNRNSQRVYRQRRIEERNEFESRATVAEETSKKLQSHVDKLESEVVELTEQIKGLERENTELRSRTNSTA